MIMEKYKTGKPIPGKSQRIPGRKVLPGSTPGSIGL